MVTDAQILTARSEYYSACVALDAATQARAVASKALDNATARVDELQKRKAEWQGRLIQLAAQKPAEPVHYVVNAPVPVNTPPKAPAGALPPIPVEAPACAPVQPTPVEPVPVTPPAVPQRRGQKAKA